MRRLILSLFLAVLAIAYARYRTADPAPPSPPPVPGRKNAILFLTTEPSGLSNVHIAAAHGLITYAPDAEVHYASFPAIEAKVRRVSDDAVGLNPKSKGLIWHGLPGPSFFETARPAWGGMPEGLVAPYGIGGASRFVDAMRACLGAWTADEFEILYNAIGKVIDEVDPAVVVLDPLFQPAVDVSNKMNRLRVVLSPNALSDTMTQQQPNGQYFWKYPAIASGYSFPVPWYQIPGNIYLSIRHIIGALFSATFNDKRAILTERGYEGIIDFLSAFPDATHWITASFPEASYPLEVIPELTTVCGPIVLETAPLDKDAEINEWMQQQPTVLVNLGSEFSYTVERGTAMAETLAQVLTEVPELQILWKCRKEGNFDDSFLEPARAHIDSGRLRVVAWLDVDPTALLKSGHIVLSVHHGGASCYHESVLAGTPQLILPLWADLYNFANLAEYTGIGIWAGRESSPRWEPAGLARDFVKALSGPGSLEMTERAKALGQLAREKYGGRKCAANALQRLAQEGL